MGQTSSRQDQGRAHACAMRVRGLVAADGSAQVQRGCLAISGT